MQSLVTLLISGVLLAMGAHAQSQYWCSTNKYQGAADHPDFVADDTNKKWTMDLYTTSDSGTCTGNVEDISTDCDVEASRVTNTIEASGDGSGTPAVTSHTLSAQLPCYLPRGECYMKISSRYASAGSCAEVSWASATWSGEDIASTSNEVSTDFTTQMDEKLVEAKATCNGIDSVVSICFSVQLGYSSECTGDPDDYFLQADYIFTDICDENSYSVSVDISETTINLGALNQDVLQAKEDLAEQTETFEVDDASYEITISDFELPDLVLVDDDGAAYSTAYTGELKQANNPAVALQLSTMTTLNGVLRTACGAMSDDVKPTVWEADGGRGSACQVYNTDCIKVTFAQLSFDCGTPDAFSDNDYGAADDDGDNGDKWSLNLDFTECPDGNENCCQQVGIKVATADNAGTQCTSQYSVAGGRRLSSRNRFLQEDEDTTLFKMGYTMAVKRSGDDSSEFVGGADPSRVSDSGGSAGWLPAVAVGGLLLLGGAVVAVTRRPSLLRGAFHGPTKVLPNEDN